MANATFRFKYKFLFYYNEVYISVKDFITVFIVANRLKKSMILALSAWIVILNA